MMMQLWSQVSDGSHGHREDCSTQHGPRRLTESRLQSCSTVLSLERSQAMLSIISTTTHSTTDEVISVFVLLHRICRTANNERTQKTNIGMCDLKSMSAATCDGERISDQTTSYIASGLMTRNQLLDGRRLLGQRFTANLRTQKIKTVGRFVPSLLVAGRTPRVSSGPEWAARESTQPARGTPCATGLACQRGTRASGGRVVRATPRRSESLPPGALGDVLMVSRVSTQSCARSRAGLHSRSVR